jgi:hypothetical protein
LSIPKAKSKHSSSVFTRLEEKLDILVSLIKAGEQSGAVIRSPHAMAAIDGSAPYGTIRISANTPIHNQSESGLVSSILNDYIQNVPVLTPATGNLTGSSHNLPPSGFRDTCGEPSSVEAEGYLINFQNCKSTYLPFTDIPSTSAQQLRQERPFLWLCITQQAQNQRHSNSYWLAKYNK